ncbi:hypothetical protein RchiOBHm_Chr7g0223911 [Rosa chinensis]|uniref:Uncharacterized protein n=1 Tax=Rosa chinensis TaxID=74649 RepID=A0A2P6PDQ5_ROSCH|nr:hypothetical protein RchiOBHm_Chr7g0223911 [Rosa chinensis]
MIYGGVPMTRWVGLCSLILSGWLVGRGGDIFLQRVSLSLGFCLFFVLTGDLIGGQAMSPTSPRVLSSLGDSSVVDHFVIGSDGIRWDRVDIRSLILISGSSQRVVAVKPALAVWVQQSDRGRPDLLFGFRVDSLMEPDGDGLGLVPSVDDGGNYRNTLSGGLSDGGLLVVSVDLRAVGVISTMVIPEPVVELLSMEKLLHGKWCGLGLPLVGDTGPQDGGWDFFVKLGQFSFFEWEIDKRQVASWLILFVLGVT